MEAPNEPKIMLYYDTGPEQCLRKRCKFPSMRRGQARSEFGAVEPERHVQGRAGKRAHHDDHEDMRIVVGGDRVDEL